MSVVIHEVPRFINRALLVANDASPNQVDLFARTFPDGCALTAAAVRHAAVVGFDIDWLVWKFFPDSLLPAYSAAKDAAREIYVLTMKKAKMAHIAAMAEARASLYAAHDMSPVDARMAYDAAKFAADSAHTTTEAAARMVMNVALAEAVISALALDANDRCHPS